MPDPRRPLDTAARVRARFGTEPVRTSRLLDCGITRAQVRAAVAAGHLAVLRPGVLVHADALRDALDPDSRHLLEVRAVVARLHDDRSDLAVSHASAAVVHRLPLPGLRVPPRWPVEVTGSAPPRRGSGDWIRHRAALPEGHVTEVDGLPVTALCRTAVDLAATRPLTESLPVADAVVRRLVPVAAEVARTPWTDVRLLMRDEHAVAAARRAVLAVLAERAPAHGHRRALRAVRAADPAVDNGFESVSRAHLLSAGLPRPEVGFPVRGDDGRTYWADLAWPWLRVLGEADGRGKYTDASVLYAEKQRQEALERAGWVVVRWTWDELARSPWVVVARVEAALRRAAARRSIVLAG